MDDAVVGSNRPFLAVFFNSKGDGVLNEPVCPQSALEDDCCQEKASGKGMQLAAHLQGLEAKEKGQKQ